MIEPSRRPLAMPRVATASSIALITGCWLSAVVPGWRYAPDLGHCWVVPILIAFLFWDRWAERPSPRPQASRPRLAWLLLGGLAVPLFGVRLLLTPFPVWPLALAFFTLLVVAGVLTGTWLAQGGPGARWVAAPLVLLLCCIPIPAVIETNIMLPLRTGIASAVAEICNGLGWPAIARGTSVQIGHSWVGIEEACSGIRSLQACAMLGLFFGEWFRFSIARRTILLALSLGVAVIGNFLRVLTLAIEAAHTGSIAPATHDTAGWLAMLVTLAVVAGIAFCWAGFKLPTTRIAADRRDVPPVTRSALAWVGAFAALLVVNDLATRLWYTRGAARAADVPQWTARLPEGDTRFHAEPLSDIARDMLHPDRYVAGRWQEINGLSAEAYFIEWTHGQVARFVPFLHNPTVCLPYSGCELEATLAPIQVSWEKGKIPFFTYRFRRAGAPLLVAFTIWDPDRGTVLRAQEPTRSFREWFASQWRDVIAGRANQPAQLLAVSLSGDHVSPDQMRAVLQTLVVPRSVNLRPPGMMRSVVKPIRHDNT